MEQEVPGSKTIRKLQSIFSSIDINGGGYQSSMGFSERTQHKANVYTLIGTVSQRQLRLNPSSPPGLSLDQFRPLCTRLSPLISGGFSVSLYMNPESTSNLASVINNCFSLSSMTVRSLPKSHTTFDCVVLFV